MSGLKEQAPETISCSDLAAAGHRVALGLGLNLTMLTAATYRHGNTVITLAGLVARLK